MTRCDERWARKGCAFWVSKRQYGDPGPCANRRGVSPVYHEDKFVRACAHHKGMVENGFHLTLTKTMRAKAKNQVAALWRFRRHIAAEDLA